MMSTEGIFNLCKVMMGEREDSYSGGEEACR